MPDSKTLHAVLFLLDETVRAKWPREAVEAEETSLMLGQGNPILELQVGGKGCWSWTGFGGLLRMDDLLHY